MTISTLRSSEVCDALDALGLHAMIIEPALVALSGDAAVSAPAYTLRVTCNLRDRPIQGTSLSAAIAAIPAGSVIVIDAAGVPFAIWGGIMTALALHRGVVGLVCAGLVRDVSQIRQQMPVFAAGVSPQRAAARVEVVALPMPVAIGGVTIHPGDHVYADRDGIVIVSAAHKDAVETTAREICEREARMMTVLSHGHGPADQDSRDAEGAGQLPGLSTAPRSR